MIKSIEIKNFQSHPSSELVFDPGVNVIVGSSDSGKTAVIRALRWLSWNLPLGDGFRSHWGGKTSVVVNIDDNLISRVKDNTLNAYFLNKSRFEAFGSKIPSEITESLGLNDINLQQQLDSPFLLSSTPGEVATHFNKIAHLDQIDTSLKQVQQWLRNSEQDIKYTIISVKERTEELKKYEPLERLEIMLDTLETLGTQRNIKFQAQRRLNALCVQIREIHYNIKNGSLILPLEEKVIQTEALIKQREATYKKIEALSYLVQTAKQLKITHQRHLSVSKLEPNLKRILKTREEHQTLSEKIKNLSKQIERTKDLQTDLKQAHNLVTEYSDLFTRNMPEQCPLCGSKTKKK